MDFESLTPQLHSDDPQARLLGLALLKEDNQPMTLPSELIAGIIACLGHNTKAIQRAAAGQLVRFSPMQPEIIDQLGQKLTDPDQRMRWTAAFALSQLPVPTPLALSVLPVLIENLGHEESDLRWAAATAVLRLAAHHPAVIPEMLSLASAGNAVQRRMALYCLRDAPQAKTGAPRVAVISLSDANPGVRLAGLSCLGKHKRAVPEAESRLVQLLESDPDIGVRRATAVTLGQLGIASPTVLKALQQAVQGGDSSLSKAATGALKKLQKN
jgi:HEAT repeat protein